MKCWVVGTALIPLLSLVLAAGSANRAESALIFYELGYLPGGVATPGSLLRTSGGCRRGGFNRPGQAAIMTALALSAGVDTVMGAIVLEPLDGPSLHDPRVSRPPFSGVFAPPLLVHLNGFIILAGMWARWARRRGGIPGTMARTASAQTPIQSERDKECDACGV